MESNIISSIIGFWRMGATIEEIIGVTLLSKDKIDEVIKDYGHKRFCQIMINKIETLTFESNA